MNSCARARVRNSLFNGSHLSIISRPFIHKISHPISPTRLSLLPHLILSGHGRETLPENFKLSVDVSNHPLLLQSLRAHNFHIVVGHHQLLFQTAGVTVE